MTFWNGNVYNREDLGLVWRVDAAGLSYVHMYTADDERVWTYQDAQGLGRWTIRDLDNKVLREFKNNGGSWSVQRDYVHRDGALLAAVLSNGQVNHLHPDHLGTPRLITANYGSGPQQVAFHAYYPYGVEATYFGQDDERLKFTGHERDFGVTWSAADDLDYMHARYYNAQVGRFLSTDPVLGEARRPQSWNRFSYSVNNSQKWVDPRGEVVSLANLTEGQRERVLKGLNDFTGNTYGLDECYNLVLEEIGTETSSTATQFLNNLIDSPITFDVQAGKDMRWNQPSYSVDLNFSRSYQYGRTDPRIMTFGSAVKHELFHAVSGLEDTLDGTPLRDGGVRKPSSDWTSPAVDFVNQIRAERGLPLRTSYVANPSLSGRSGVLKFQKWDDPKNVTKIRYKN